MGIPAVEVVASPGTGQLLAVRELPEDPHGVGVGSEALTGQEIEIQAFGAVKAQAGEVAFDLLERKGNRARRGGHGSAG